MFVVALTYASGELEKEAAAIAALVGVTAYDARAWLSGVLPRVVHQGAVEVRAQELATQLRARGHGALAFDARDAVAGAAMVHMHRFVLGEREITPNDDRPERLAYDDIAVIVAVARRIDVVRRTLEPAAEPRIGRPTPRHAAPEQRTSFEHVHDRVAYLFPRRVRGEGAPRPWMLHEREGQYLSLAERMQATQRANFNVSLEILRARAPGAIFDDRFVASPRALASVAQVRGRDSPTPELTDHAVELVVHALATWLTAARAGPYR